MAKQPTMADIWEGYDKEKVHGNIGLSAKCEWCWHQGILCLHQTYERDVDGVDEKFILKRDFKIKK